MKRKLHAGAMALVVVLTGGVANQGEVRAQVASTFVSSAGTALVLDTLFNGLNETIQNAQDAGDYVTAMAAARAKDVLMEWQRVNSALLDKTFGELDKASQENFGRASKLITEFNDPLKDRLQTAQQMVNVANQIAQSLPIPGGKQVYVTEYKPRIAPPNERKAVMIRLNGVNLDKGDPQLRLATKSLDRVLPGPLEVSFAIPVGALPGDRTKLNVVRLDLEYSTPKDGVWAWITGATETVKRQLSLGVLPETIGTFKLTGVQAKTIRESESFRRDLSTFRGTNTRKRSAATPKPGGWLWDLNQPFQVVQTTGEAASCEGPFLNEASPNGVPVGAKLKKIQDARRPLGAPAWVNCALVGTVYRELEQEAPIPEQVGTINWTDDIQVPLPAGLKSWTVTVKTFDGRTRSFNSTDADKFLFIKKSVDAVTLVPRVPSDLQ